MCYVHKQPLSCRIKFQLPFNKIKRLSDYSRLWQVKGQWYDILCATLYIHLVLCLCD